jgi:paxillin
LNQPQSSYNQPQTTYSAQPAYTPQPSVTPHQPQPTYNTQPTYNAQPTYNTQPATQRPVSGAPGGELDSLLKDLNQQLSGMVNDSPYSKGTCSTCKQAILGEVVTAVGKTFHPEHFVCGNCRNPLGSGVFYEQGGVQHCERCYQELFCPRCGHCDKPVMDRCITAMGKKWHVEHFICTQCLRPFENGNFFEKDGRPYCDYDFFNLFAPKCGGCGEPIRADSINALGVQWHPEHFACAYCRKSLAGGVFFEHQGKPYCETHYHMQLGSLCSGCGKPIAGRVVSALDKKWHPEHFVCAFCMNPLAGGSFLEKNHKAYCRDCHNKLFGPS